MNELPLNSLRALAAVWAEGGVRPAARSLSVAPSAVHRHIRLVEFRLGVAVTEGVGRTFRLTPEGERIARLCAQTLKQLERKLTSAQLPSRANRVIVTLTESFAREWLLPRLDQFLSGHPQVEIWMRTERRLVDPGRESALAIRMGDAATVGNGAIEWLHDYLVPVLSPDLAGRSGIKEVRDLTSVPRLHDFDAQTSWIAFADHHGMPREGLDRGMRVGSDSLVLDAAEAGLGVALSRRKLVERRIASGKLVALDEMSMYLGPAYWLLPNPAMRPAARDFLSWLETCND